MNELLSLAFIQRGLAGAVIIGATCSLIGVFIVLRGMSYIGTGIAHGSLAGVALALLLGWSPLPLSIITGLAMILLIELVGKKGNLKIDTSIGVIFSLAMAFAVLFIGMAKNYTPDIKNYLFGNILAVTSLELWIMGGIGAAVATAVVLFYKELQFSIYDPEMAEVSGIPARAILLALSFLMALTIVASLRAVGELLILALIVLPASSAYQWAHSLRRMIFISIILGISASISGLIMAFNLEAPAGSTIVILLGLIFFASLVFGERRSNRF